MKSRSKTKSRTAATAPLNSPNKQRLTFDQIVEKWAGVFEPEFWDEVDRARDCYPPPKERQQ